ncbi:MULTISPECIES: hypothetical protein [Microbacterium]|uniref:hypothetical protein n=1 Tax=Microbacterium TaxID=33882 RepID=UPI00278551E0|nr:MULTISPECIES: hypothetical protein [Microbacterium]MDQ1082254.1 2,4-dienoyl-CoA reductase-like NADH-dependent reductase (Old Yellow Enzyme family) [Microbacterium sp. SORGH_AS_0344]MDQ1168975.1 2,4-dienoyl-CoA reductase-like NADH-dependent reductase (Old Yellow Enzyme family) [Microbacterium proteolyticum]
MCRSRRSDVQGRGAHLLRVAAARRLLDADRSSDLIQDLRRTFGGTFIVNSGFSRMTTRDEAVTAVEENIADLIAVGRPAIANPGRIARNNFALSARGVCTDVWPML